MRSPSGPEQADGHRPPPGVVIAAAALAAGPVALAFFSGGYFDRPRVIALLGVAPVLVLLAVAAPARHLLLRGVAAPAALAGFAGLALWVALSGGRSPVPDMAADDAERVLLYAAFLAAGSVAWRSRPAARLAEPAVAAGIVVVIGFGLAGRWLPGVVELTATVSAGGRLEQPLTYWNATGMLAGVGAVLCARLAGDPDRGGALRAAAAAGAVPLLCGVYLSFSRGALAALVAGLLVLVLCAPSMRQLRAIATTVLAGAPAVLATALLPGVRALEGTAAARERDGLVALAVTLAAMAAAAGATAWWARSPAGDPLRPGRSLLPRPARWALVAAIVLTVVGPVLAGRGGDDGRARPEAGFGATTQRFANVRSNRYAYWDVALDSFADRPLVGVGSGGWGTEWLRERPIGEAARDAHSVELETLAELGLVGLGLLALAFGGVAGAAVVLQRRDPQVAAGASAGLTVWLAHATLDWDWELPAVTLPALTLAAVLIARAQEPVRG